MMSSEALGRDEAIGQFCGVTGADKERARGLLEACDWNLELAVNMHVDTDDGRNNKPSTSTRASGQSSFAPGPSTSNATPIVSIPESIEEEDEDGNMISDPRNRINSTSCPSRGTSGGRSNPYCDIDDVRPPIPPVREVLQAPGNYPSDLPPRSRTRAMHDVYDAFRDFQAEAQWQEMENDQESAASSNANKRRTLHDLFRPPREVMFHGSFISAREIGERQNKWLLVNIQNGREFACQILNRDVWSNQTVKDILKEHFIFWQVYFDSSEGQRYTQFYHVSKFPHVSIVDPRTGEELKSWPTSIDHNSFCDSVIEFLTERPSLDGSTACANTMKKLRKTLYDQSEEAQLEAAIKASLQETEDSNSSRAYVDDDSCVDVIESDSEAPDAEVQDNEVQVIKDHDVKVQNVDVHDVKAQDAEIQDVGPQKTRNEEEIEDYRKYLGTDNEKLSELVVRFPDGTRDKFKFPSDSLMKALFLLLSSRGYGVNRFNYLTNFPKRLIHELPSTDTFQEAKLNGEMIFVERKADDEH